MDRDAFQALAWAGFISFASNNSDMIAAFEQETGRRFHSPPSSPIAAAIDAATGLADDNARHPGCTREHCVICGEETGRAGRHEDSIYREGPDGEEVGPLCDGCDSEMEVTNG